jgi:hypothetical protein
MGKGTIPLYSYWQDKHLGYVEARKTIYIPIYTELVKRTLAFGHLEQAYFNSLNLTSQPDFILLDYDAYDHRALGMSLKDVANNSSKKCGHAFVLMSLLTGESIL